VARSRSLILPIAMMAVAMPVLVGLGIWQWHRLGEKLALVERIEQRSQAAPRAVHLKDLLDGAVSVDELEYAPVSLQGRFLDAHEAAVFTNLDQPVGPFGGPGYDILALFEAEGGGHLLVNRGFVPDRFKSPASRADARIENDITLTAYVRKPERRTYLDLADEPAKNVFFLHDPHAILTETLSAEERLRLSPLADAFYLQLQKPVPPGGLPQPLPLQLNIPNNHLQYALTWWGLALVFAIMFAVFLQGRSREKRAVDKHLNRA